MTSVFSVRVFHCDIFLFCFFIKVKGENENILTDTRVATGDEHNLVREVTTLQDVQSSRVSVKALWFDDHILHRERLTRVKMRRPLVNVAGTTRRNRCALKVIQHIHSP